VRWARARRTRRAQGGAAWGLPVLPAGGAAVVSGVKAGLERGSLPEVSGAAAFSSWAA